MRLQAITFLLALPFAACTAAAAAPISPLAAFFQQKIESVEKAMRAAEQSPSPEHPIVFTDVNFDLAPTVSFGISKVLNLSLTPEIDFVVVPEETNDDPTERAN